FIKPILPFARSRSWLGYAPFAEVVPSPETRVASKLARPCSTDGGSGASASPVVALSFADEQRTREWRQNAISESDSRDNTGNICCTLRKNTLAIARTAMLRTGAKAERRSPARHFGGPAAAISTGARRTTPRGLHLL